MYIMWRILLVGDYQIKTVYNVFIVFIVYFLMTRTIYGLLLIDNVYKHNILLVSISLLLNRNKNITELKKTDTNRKFGVSIITL